jgi:hypothetical protein
VPVARRHCCFFLFDQTISSSINTRLGAIVKHSTVVAIAAFFMTSILGCGEGGPKLVPVKGKLYIDDKPFGPCTLLLNPDGGGDSSKKTNPPTGIVGDDGSFVLKTADRDGAAAGSYSLSLAAAPASIKNPNPNLMGAAAPPGIKPVKVVIPAEGYPNGFDLKCEGTGEAGSTIHGVKKEQ